MIAEVGDGSEAGIVDEVGSGVVADAFEEGGEDQGEGDDVPGVVHVDEMRNEGTEIEVPLAVRQAEGDGAFRGVRAEDLIEDGLEEEGAEGVEDADRGQQQDAGKPLQAVGKAVAEEAEEVSHAGWTAWAMESGGTGRGRGAHNCIPVL